MITDTCQRWELGREFRRPAGETIRAAEAHEQDLNDRANAFDDHGDE